MHHKIINDAQDLTSILPTLRSQPHRPRPTRILMVTPDFFDVKYIINPHMQNAEGKPNVIDRELAQKQWKQLKDVYEQCGIEVITLPGQSGFPDMVFAANQSLPFWDSSGKKAVILSHMATAQRFDEVPFFRTWYTHQGYEVLPPKHPTFEGAGDALWHYPYPLVWGGYGLRTQKATYDELVTQLYCTVALLELTDPIFYHLDTCMSILRTDTIALCRKGLTTAGNAMIDAAFPHVISVSKEEAVRFFACNCHCPNDKDVILQRGARHFVQDLRNHGFYPIEVDLSEFQKAGGSVSCLKMMIY